jgi:hypothetical protein
MDYLKKLVTGIALQSVEGILTTLTIDLPNVPYK